MFMHICIYGIRRGLQAPTHTHTQTLQPHTHLKIIIRFAFHGSLDAIKNVRFMCGSDTATRGRQTDRERHQETEGQHNQLLLRPVDSRDNFQCETVFCIIYQLSWTRTKFHSILFSLCAFNMPNTNALGCDSSTSTASASASALATATPTAIATATITGEQH